MNGRLNLSGLLANRAVVDGHITPAQQTLAFFLNHLLKQ
jgi:hypothetical protein